LVVLAALAVFLGWWLTRDEDLSASPAHPQAQAPAPEAFVDSLQPTRLDAPAAERVGDRKFPAAAFDPARFDGVARLEIFLVVQGDYSGPWTLSLEPSKVLLGGERAVARHVEYPSDQRHVVLDDVQLGGYVVRAIAPGMECAPLFVQFSQPDELDVVLQLRLFDAGSLSGRVVGANGQPVERMEVRVRRGDPDLELVASTDSRGEYVFERLLDGEYVVVVGRAESPLATRDVAFSAPGFTMPDIALPPLGELSVRVLDSNAKPVTSASVSVIGLASGALKGTTDEQGYARFPHCVSGSATVVADHPDWSTQTRQFRFDAELPEQVEVRLAPR